MAISSPDTINNYVLPMWDTFEAIFFLIAGGSIGFVFGITFPSIWRTFRRKFRKGKKYTPTINIETSSITPNLKILKSRATEPEDKEIVLSIAEKFTLARYLFQIGNSRDSVQAYLALYKDERISGHGTNQVLFELSQVYFSINITARAYETAYELLKRKPNNFEAFLLLLKIIEPNYNDNQLTECLSLYKGRINEQSARHIAHLFARIGEKKIQQKKTSEAISLSHKAIKYDRTSARALLLLWQSTSYEFWNSSVHDTKSAWVTFASEIQAVVQILLETKCSAMSAITHLQTLISMLATQQNSVEVYHSVEKEIQQIFGKNEVKEEECLKRKELAFYLQLYFSANNKEYDEIENLSILPALYNKVILMLSQASTVNDNLAITQKATFTGYTTHICIICNSSHAHFTWTCLHCNGEETLVPEVAVLQK